MTEATEHSLLFLSLYIYAEISFIHKRVSRPPFAFIFWLSSFSSCLHETRSFRTEAYTNRGALMRKK